LSTHLTSIIVRLFRTLSNMHVAQGKPLLTTGVWVMTPLCLLRTHRLGIFWILTSGSLSTWKCPGGSGEFWCLLLSLVVRLKLCCTWNDYWSPLFAAHGCAILMIMLRGQVVLRDDK